MGNEILATYLNDHLAGSVMAVELLDHLRELSKGTERDSGSGELRLLEALERRAREQHERVDTERLKVAHAAFGS